jgi:sulfonate transport system ATP-binding protein
MNPLLDIFVSEKRYGQRTVLRDLHLSVAAGEVVTLVGASGCGKSTLLSLVAGLDPDFRGKVALDGRATGGISEDIGFIFQEPRLFPWLSVSQNITFGKGTGAQRDPLVATLLEEVGLAGYEDALPKQLSGGQAQRVAIARGLFTRPRVLLLDEPFSAVDAFTRMRLQDLLAKVVREHGLTVLMVTHDIDEALYLSDRVVLLDGGPGPARGQFDVPLPRPRLRSESASGALKAAVLSSLEAAHAF